MPLETAVEEDVADGLVIGQLSLVPGGRAEGALRFSLVATAKGEYPLTGTHAVEGIQGYPAFAGLEKDAEAVAGTQIVERFRVVDRGPFTGVGSAAAECGADLVREIISSALRPWRVGFLDCCFVASVSRPARKSPCP